jgi:hypothetical protein
MKILFDRNVEPKYINAISSIPSVSVEHVDEYLPQDANDSEIINLAKREKWIVFTRDDDFFQPARGQGVGLLYFPKKHDTLPGEIKTSIELIKDAYRPRTARSKRGSPASGSDARDAIDALSLVKAQNNPSDGWRVDVLFPLAHAYSSTIDDSRPRKAPSPSITLPGRTR